MKFIFLILLMVFAVVFRYLYSQIIQKKICRIYNIFIGKTGYISSLNKKIYIDICGINAFECWENGSSIKIGRQSTNAYFTIENIIPLGNWIVGYSGLVSLKVKFKEEEKEFTVISLSSKNVVFYNKELDISVIEERKNWDNIQSSDVVKLKKTYEPATENRQSWEQVFFESWNKC